MSSTPGSHPASALAYRRRNAWDCLSPAGKESVFAFAEEYKQFLNDAKTEREAVAAAAGYAVRTGFTPLDSKNKLAPGDRVFAVGRGKSIILAVIGKASPESGLKIVGAHVDSPRLDLKPQPLYEDEWLTLLKTHYYGGVKKYQWLAVPLSLHGVVVKSDGTAVPVVIGERPGDPVFTITDLLPHLAKDQMEKKLSDAFAGENLNLLAGGIPLGDSELKDRFKLAVLDLLHREYGIREEDLISAELEAVPAWSSRDVGFDRSFVGGYGQDDRVCAFAALRAIGDVALPSRTALVLLADKEETGSAGNTGMQSAFFANFVAEIILRAGGSYSELALRRSLSASTALSADVNAGFDPNFPDVLEKMNAARAGGGLVLTKYTGSKGKYGTNDAHAEVMACARRLFDRAGVVWQTGELGKVDQGGGGTIAHYLAEYGMDVLDCGVALLSMHAPFEVCSKVDVYMAYKGYNAFLSE
ncbi:MAG: aminopeptidase [Firmicutes bacterium]|nr:aminopeptidase [Bacillota bacterium]